MIISTRKSKKETDALFESDFTELPRGTNTLNEEIIWASISQTVQRLNDSKRFAGYAENKISPISRLRELVKYTTPILET